MKYKLLIVFLIGVAFGSYSQIAENLEGHKILFTADSLYRLGDYNSAANKFREAIFRFTEENSPGYIAKALNGLAEMQWRMYQLEKAKITVDHALSIYEGRNADDSLSIINQALSHNSLGVISGMSGQFSNALKEFVEAIKIGNKDSTITKNILGIAHHNVGRLYSKFGEPDSALYHYEKSIAHKDTLTTKDKINLADTYFTIGTIYTNKGYHDQALNYSNRALKIQKKFLGSENPRLAFTFSQIGIIYFNLGQDNLATEYLKEAIKVVKVKKEMETHLLNFYGYLIDILIEEQKYNEALSLLRETLNLRTSSKVAEEIDIALTYDNFAKIFLEIGQLDSASKYVSKSLIIKEVSEVKKGIFFADSYVLQARLNHKLGESVLADFYLDKGIKSLNQSYKKGPYLSSIYNLKGDYATAKEQYN